MAKSKALIAAEAEITALKARLDVAVSVFKTQRATIVDLEAKLATRGVVAPQPKVVETVVSQFSKRDGSVWESHRTGTRTVLRCIQPALQAA